MVLSFLLLFLIIPLLLTLIVEGALAGLVLWNKKDLVTVLLAQCITNPVINMCLVLSALYLNLNNIGLMIVLEIVAVIVEGIIYQKRFSEANVWKAWLFSIVANVASVMVGLVAIQWLW